MHRLDPKAKWLFFISSMSRFIIIFAVILFSVIPAFFSMMSAQSDPEFFWGFLSFNVFLPLIVLLFVLGFSYLWAHLAWIYYKYELSDIGFKKESGVIYKKYVTIPYGKIQNVDINRGILARLLGLSDLHIQTAGISYTGRGGASSEGRLPGLSKSEAEKLRDELVRRASHSKSM